MRDCTGRLYPPPEKVTPDYHTFSVQYNVSKFWGSVAKKKKNCQVRTRGKQSSLVNGVRYVRPRGSAQDVSGRV